MCVIDITICLETNLSKSREYKITKCTNIEHKIKRKYKKVVKLYIEVTLK